MSDELKLQDTTTMPVVGKPPSVVKLKWDGDHRFDAGSAAGGPTIRIDASRKTGPGPVDVLLLALGSCTAIDVIEILAKRRTPIDSLDIEVVGERAPCIPSSVSKATLTYHITSATADREHAERAIELSITKYCSVRDSLDPNMPVEWRLVLNGEG
jgi:putative redox protein